MVVTNTELTDPRAYQRLAARIRRQISDGTLGPSRPVPSITSLSREYGHARQTCSKALRMLARVSVDHGFVRPAGLPA